MNHSRQPLVLNLPAGRRLSVLCPDDRRALDERRTLHLALFGVAIPFGIIVVMFLSAYLR